MIKKLNNKGYLLVEIIVSFVIAMSVAYFLAEITINLKDRQEDLDKEIQYNVDKALMTKEVMDDVEKNGVKKIEEKIKNNEELKYEITFLDNTKKTLDITKTQFKYGDASYTYSKEFDSSLNIKLDITNTKIDINNKIFTLKVKATSIYSDKDYGINLIIPYTE